MAWNFEQSKTRVRDEWKRLKTAGIGVKPLTREMDLSNLSPTDTRLVTGVHLYADITNIGELLVDPLQRRDDYRRIYRTLHLTRVELRRILQTVFCGDKIQVQGSKFHGLLFRPYNEPQAIANAAVVAGLAIFSTLTEAFGAVFDAYPKLVPAVGLDFGDSLVANIGMRGDRELISIGNAANTAAKLLRGGENALTVGKSLYDALDAERQAWFEECGSSYRLDCTSVEDIESVVADAGFNWSVQSSVSKFEEGKANLPLEDISIEDLREKIDIGRLGPRRAKVCPAATLFADIDGYTALIEALDGDTEQLTKAVQVLHLFRYELRHVAETDYDGIAVQHQGDRLQALLHSPGKEDEVVMEDAVNLCIGCNSSTEEVLNEYHDVLGKLHLGIGCAFSKTLVGMLGTKGDRDPVCIGEGPAAAETIQLTMPGNSMGIPQELRDAITAEEIAKHFKWNKSVQWYAAEGVTYSMIEEAADTQAYRSAQTAGYTKAGSIIIGGGTPDIVPLKVTRPYFA